MAASVKGVDNHGESSPLLNKNAEFDEEKEPMDVPEAGCMANGLPVGQESADGEPIMGRAQWDSSLIDCLGRNDSDLQANFEALSKLSGFCESCVEDELQHDRCELACDLATHMLCHPVALCQEGREIRHRVPHPGFNAQPVVVMNL